MPDSRSAILRQIRTALGRGPLSDSAAAALDARRPAHTRIAFDEDLVERFVARFESRSGTVARVSHPDAIPVAVAAYRQAHGLPPRAAVARPLAGLPWPAGFAHHPGPAGPDEQMSVTPCLAGIAEIGSLMLASGPDSPTTLNFVPDHHLIVLPAGHIVRHFEDAWTLLRALPGGLPRATNIISGPSRTGDVELTIQLGAHGPRSVHVLLVEDGPAAGG
jgi:L-lactate dehydrogenase complex protein LldG